MLKGYNSTRLLAEFPKKNWKKGLKKLLRKIGETGGCDRRDGSGRPNSALTDDNVTQVEELVLSQENKPQTHRSTRQISRECGLSQSSVILFVTIDVECIVLIWKWLFVTVISQGSVATRLRCGGQCDSQFVANFLMSMSMSIKYLYSANNRRSNLRRWRVGD